MYRAMMIGFVCLLLAGCGSDDSETNTGNNGDNNGTPAGCCRYSCNTAFGIVNGYSTDASDEDSCYDFAALKCQESDSHDTVGCSTYASESCAVADCNCIDLTDENICPAEE